MDSSLMIDDHTVVVEVVTAEVVDTEVVVVAATVCQLLVSLTGADWQTDHTSLDHTTLGTLTEDLLDVRPFYLWYTDTLLIFRRRPTIR